MTQLLQGSDRKQKFCEGFSSQISHMGLVTSVLPIFTKLAYRKLIYVQKNNFVAKFWNSSGCFFQKTAFFVDFGYLHVRLVEQSLTPHPPCPEATGSRYVFGRSNSCYPIEDILRTCLFWMSSVWHRTILDLLTPEDDQNPIVKLLANASQARRPKKCASSGLCNTYTLCTTSLLLTRQILRELRLPQTTARHIISDDLRLLKCTKENKLKNSLLQIEVLTWYMRDNCCSVLQKQTLVSFSSPMKDI